MRLWEKGGSLDAEVAAFTVGSDPVLDLRWAFQDIAASAAHVRVQEEAGLLSEEEAIALIGGLGKVAAQLETGNFRIEAAHEDVHTEVEIRLGLLLGPLAGKLHTGRSRNDQILTDLRLWIKQELCEAEAEWLKLVQRFFSFAEQYHEVPLTGFTHLQPAMPSSYGLWAAGYGAALLDTKVLLEAAYQLADRCPLGSAAGYGTPLPLNRALAAKLLGFSKVEEPETSCQLSRGLVESAALGALGAGVGLLARWAWDLSLFTSSGFALIKLPDAFTTGSSIMPQKRNPDVAELLRASIHTIRAAQREIEDICTLPGGYHRDVQACKAPLVRGIDTAREVLRIATHLLPALEPTPRPLEPALFAAAEAFARKDLPFREAYRVVAAQISEGCFQPTTTYKPPTIKLPPLQKALPSSASLHTTLSGLLNG
jgi:argininosuccinate lyase